MNTFSAIALHYRNLLKAASQELPKLPHKLKEGHITDDNQSVRWNREQVILHNQNLDKSWDERVQASQQIYTQYEEACLALLQKKYTLPPAIAQICWQQAYDAGHSLGFELISEKLDTYAEYTVQVVNATKITHL